MSSVKQNGRVKRLSCCYEYKGGSSSGKLEKHKRDDRSWRIRGFIRFPGKTLFFFYLLIVLRVLVEGCNKCLKLPCYSTI